MPESEDIDVDDLWFQQNRATCHTFIGGNFWSAHYLASWTFGVVEGRSCILTSLDFFFVGLCEVAGLQR